MKVALTGSSGNIGGRIASVLERHGHEVIRLGRRPCGKNWVRYQMGDDPYQLPWLGVDTLIHCAHDFKPCDWSSIVTCNVNPSICLFHAAAEAKVSKRIFISSLSSFDGCHSMYGKAKRKIELEVLSPGTTVIRPGLVWGSDSGGVMYSLEHAVRLIGVIPYPFGGNEMQFTIHVDDLTDSIVSLAERPPSARSELLCYANQQPLSLQHILRVIAKRQNVSRVILPIPWPLLNAVLKTAEVLRIPLPFRSDSLIGLVHGLVNPAIDSPPNGITFRSFL